jgi:membrane dipeptidase
MSLSASTLLTLGLLAAKPPDPAVIHNSAVIVDTHVDTPQRFVDEDFDFTTETPTTEGHLDLGKARAANLGAAFFSIWVDPRPNQGKFAHRTLALIDGVLRQVERHPQELTLALSADDILKARTSRPRKFAMMMGIEGGHSIENDLSLLRDYHRLGVRYMTLTWSNTNEWADSSGDQDDAKVIHHGGLTDFGRDVVREMNRLGMLVDVSHVSDKTFWDTLEVTKAPVIASHSSARALTDSARNMTDDMLRAVAKNGGAVMVNFYPAFIDDTFRKAYAAQKLERAPAIDALMESLKNADVKTRSRAYNAAQREWAAKLPRPKLDALIDHLHHVAQVAGADHVGLGSDFDGISALPQGLESAADLPRITEALVQRGYTKEQIHKMLGGNFLRVFKAAQNYAQSVAVKASAR